MVSFRGPRFDLEFVGKNKLTNMKMTDNCYKFVLPRRKKSTNMAPGSMQQWKLTQKFLIKIFLITFILIFGFLFSIEFPNSRPSLVHYSNIHFTTSGGRPDTSYHVFEDSPTICTYFEPFSSDRQDEFQAIVKLWNHSWRTQGWNTRVFSEKDAAKYPGYEELKAQFLDLPTVNDRRFEMSCYLRWLAMVATGCRWMSDIDMINFGFPPQQPWHGPVLHSYGGVMPALVTGSTDAFQAVVDTLKKISQDPLNSTSVINVNHHPHVSDMLVFASNPHLYLPLSFPLYASSPKALASSPLIHFSFDDAKALLSSAAGSRLDLIAARRIEPDPDPPHSPPTVCTYSPGHDAGRAAAREWRATFDQWNRSWAAQGWATRVLTERDAAAHPRYRQLREKLITLAAANPSNEAGSAAARAARYLRWVAVVARGCRWMCDSDVVNLGFPPQPPWHGPVLYSFDGPEPTLVTGGPAAFRAALAALEETADAALRHGALPPAVTDDGRPVTADARVLGARPGLYLDVYFPLNASFPGPRAHSPLLHLDAAADAAADADADGVGAARAALLHRLRPLAPDPRPPGPVPHEEQ
jgi:hypothetical protein